MVKFLGIRRLGVDYARRHLECDCKRPLSGGKRNLDATGRRLQPLSVDKHLARPIRHAQAQLSVFLRHNAEAKHLRHRVVAAQFHLRAWKSDVGVRIEVHLPCAVL